MWLERANNKFRHTIDFLLENIIAGFITEFAVDTTNSYTTAKRIY
jgi:hypothetical protein